jgi:hypothetical protein
MEREVKLYGMDSWKWYCHTDPGGSGGGFSIDDDMSAKFYEKSRELGVRLFSVHKGFSYQSRTLGHLANPKDVEKAALQNPDLTFVIYHSALKHGPNEADYVANNQFDPTTGDFLWHNVLMDIQEAQSEDEQCLLRDRLVVWAARGREPGDVPTSHRQEHQELRIRPRDLGNRLPVVGLAAVGNRFVQAVPVHR